MSRRQTITATIAMLLGVWALPTLAQQAGPAPSGPPAGPTDQDIAERARQDAANPNRLRRRCAPSRSGEITVCAPDDGADQRVPSTGSAPDPNTLEGRRALNNGMPHADVGTKYPGPVVARGCFLGPCPKAPAYLLDFSTLPDAPAGSDADRISKGEKRAD